jgi:hypothetical protein
VKLGQRRWVWMRRDHLTAKQRFDAQSSSFAWLSSFASAANQPLRVCASRVEQPANRRGPRNSSSSPKMSESSRQDRGAKFHYGWWRVAGLQTDSSVCEHKSRDPDSGTVSKRPGERHSAGKQRGNNSGDREREESVSMVAAQVPTPCSSYVVGRLGFQPRA